MAEGDQSSSPDAPVNLDAWWLHTSDSEFARVVFCEVAESYPTDGDIECRYRFSGKLRPDPNAKIGLYRIGWNSPHEYITYLTCGHASVHVNGSGEEHILLFKGGELPKDDGEFYQFCYIDSDEQIHGASIPFRFRSPHVDDLAVCAESEDHDFVVVHSRLAVFEEKLQQTQQVRNDLQKANADLQCRLEQLYLTEKVLLQKRDESALTIQQLESQVEDLKVKVQLLETEVRQQQCTVKEKEDECSQLLCHLSDAEVCSRELQSTIKDMVEKQDDLLSQIKLQEEKYTSRQVYVKHLESKVQNAKKEHKEECATLFSRMEDLEQLEQHCLSLENQVKALQVENEKLKDQSQREKDSLQENLEILCSQFENTKAMLEAQEDTKALMKRELEADKEFRSKITHLLENVQAENFMLKQKLKASESARVLEKEQIKELSAQVKELQSRLEEGAKEFRRQYSLRNKLEHKLKKLRGSARSSISELTQSVHVLSAPDDRQSSSLVNSDADTGESCSGGTVNSDLPAETKDGNESSPNSICASCRSETEVKQPLSFIKFPSSNVPVPPQEQQLTGISESSIITQDSFENLATSRDNTENLLGVNSNLSQLETCPPPCGSTNILVPVSQVPEIDTSVGPSMITFTEESELPSIYDVPCPVCEETFTVYSEDTNPLIVHLQLKHLQNPCPVCSSLFDLTLPSQYFEYHVQDHFRNDDLQVVAPTI